MLRILTPLQPACIASGGLAGFPDRECEDEFVGEMFRFGVAGLDATQALPSGGSRSIEFGAYVCEGISEPRK